MAYDLNTKVSDVLNNPEAVKIMDQIIPGMSHNPMIDMAKAFTLGKIINVPGARISESKMHQFIDACNARGI